MKNKKWQITLAAVIVMVSLLGGCSKPGEPVEAVKEVEQANKVEEEKEVGNIKEIESKQEAIQDDQVKEVIEDMEASVFSFSDLACVDFEFSSGAGAWSTYLNVHPDGSFDGKFHDADMGCTGPDYPAGTLYFCDFYGEFMPLEKINDYTYATKINYMRSYEEPGEEEIEDERLVIYSEPYGLCNSERILIYLPGAPIKELPEEYLNWVDYGPYSGKTDEELPFYGLYNEKDECGFSGREWEETVIDIELASIEKKVAQLEEGFDMMPQSEMNQTSQAVYELWDDELNSIWGRLKEKLDKETMEALTISEREWIAYKESEVKAAGAECEGGTLQPLLESSTGAMLTKHRVYYLAAYLR